MDSSITRRGQDCWYRLPNVGTIAINDAFLLESAIYFLLKTHFRKQTYYVDLLEHFHEARDGVWTSRSQLTRRQATLQTEIGQLVDLITAPETHVDLSKFSLEKCASARWHVHLPMNSQTPPHRRVQDRVLLVLLARRARDARLRAAVTC